MPDPEEQVAFDQLPPRVQHSFADLRASLTPGLVLSNFCRLSDGWGASLYDTDGRNCGDYCFLDESEWESHG
jgi:hypothetical protein